MQIMSVAAVLTCIVLAPAAAGPSGVGMAHVSSAQLGALNARLKDAAGDCLLLTQQVGRLWLRFNLLQA